MNNEPNKKNIVAKVFSAIFAGFMVLAVILSLVIHRDADPKYPDLWLEYKNDKIKVDYPNTWSFESSIKTENFFENRSMPEGTKNELETVVFELKGTNCTIVITMIPKIEENVLTTMYPGIKLNTAVKKVDKEGYQNYEYASERLEKYSVIMRGYYTDDRGAEDMRRIIQHMGDDLRNNNEQ